MTTIFAAAFGFGVGFDLAVTSFWDRWNKGVSLVPVSLRQRSLLTVKLLHLYRSNGKTSATAMSRLLKRSNSSRIHLQANRLQLPCFRTHPTCPAPRRRRPHHVSREHAHTRLDVIQSQHLACHLRFICPHVPALCPSYTQSRSCQMRPFVRTRCQSRGACFSPSGLEWPPPWLRSDFHLPVTLRCFRRRRRDWFLTAHSMPLLVLGRCLSTCAFLPQSSLIGSKDTVIVR